MSEIGKMDAVCLWRDKSLNIAKILIAEQHSEEKDQLVYKWKIPYQNQNQFENLHIFLKVWNLLHYRKSNDAVLSINT